MLSVKANSFSPPHISPSFDARGLDRKPFFWRWISWWVKDFALKRDPGYNIFLTVAFCSPCFVTCINKSRGGGRGSISRRGDIWEHCVVSANQGIIKKRADSSQFWHLGKGLSACFLLPHPQASAFPSPLFNVLCISNQLPHLARASGSHMSRQRERML